jgi:hypothetical protein
MGGNETKSYRHGAYELEEQLEGVADCYCVFFHIHSTAVQEYLRGCHCDWMADLFELVEQKRRSLGGWQVCRDRVSAGREEHSLAAPECNCWCLKCSGLLKVCDLEAFGVWHTWWRHISKIPISLWKGTYISYTYIHIHDQASPACFFLIILRSTSFFPRFPPDLSLKMT